MGKVSGEEAEEGPENPSLRSLDFDTERTPESGSWWLPPAQWTGSNVTSLCFLLELSTPQQSRVGFQETHLPVSACMLGSPPQGQKDAAGVEDRLTRPLLGNAGSLPVPWSLNPLS